ncbi:MAG: DUF2079 domain-containing protein [Oligoflexia bacterium]|nr:DUF2079 domain-containing protein [Oligoflexia bacterium]
MKIGLKVWDFLFWALVIFPVLTGGLWIDKPGLRIELTQISIPLAILGIFPIFIYKFRAEFVNTSSMQWIRWLWHFWSLHLEKSPIRTLIISYTFFSLLWALTALERHWAFSSGYADLGIFTNAIWNLVNGNGYISSVKNGMNLFADHQSPIFWLTYPFFYIYQKAETLLILQSFILCSAGIATYLLAKQYKLSREWIAAAPLIFWFFNPIRNANRFDFHPEVSLLPFFLFAIWGLQSNKKINKLMGIIFLLLAMMGKESSGLVLLGVCSAWILGSSPKETRWFTRVISIPLSIIALAHFYFCLKIVPGYFSNTYQYSGAYSHFGPSLSDLILSPFKQPSLFFEHLFGKDRVKFFLGTIAPLAFLPLFSMRTFIASAPGYLIYFLSQGSHRVNLGYHYAIESCVGVLWAFILGVKYFSNKKFIQKIFNEKYLLPLVFFCLFIAYGRSEIFFIRKYSTSPHYSWIKKEIFPQIPKNAKTSSTGTLVPHIANRPWAHHLPEIRIQDGLPGTQIIKQEEYVDCIYWSKNPEVNQTPMNDQMNIDLEKKILTLGFIKEFNCKGLEVWKNLSYTEPSCLLTTPSCE